MSKVVIMCLLLLGAQTALSEVKRVREACETTDFDQEVFPQLRVQIPEVNTLWERITRITKMPENPYRVLNCTVSYPSENGKPVSGMRQVGFQQLYYTNEGKKLQHHGMRFEYYKWEDRFEERSYYVKDNVCRTARIPLRALVSLEFCVTVESCKRIGFPFTDDRIIPGAPSTKNKETSIRPEIDRTIMLEVPTNDGKVKVEVPKIEANLIPGPPSIEATLIPSSSG